jgi:hypothetical protein
MVSPLRLAPEFPLPPYAYVTGRFPHPTRDRAGHSHGHAPPAPAPLVPERWRDSREYLFGCDLFNHGYYWEAHETWEGLWQAAGRKGVTADFLKGLIKLAAAGVKAREGRPQGVRRHAKRAIELLERVSEHTKQQDYLGLDVAELIEVARSLESHPPTCRESDAPVEIVFDFRLVPAGS